MTDNKTQLDKFKQAASNLGTDDDPGRVTNRPPKLVQQKPMEKPE